jgi:hypothetical protein
MNWMDLETNSHGLGYYPGIFLEGLKKNMKTDHQDSRCPAKDLNQAQPELGPRSVNNKFVAATASH